MPRKPRIHFPGALYHVMARGNRNQRIFLDDRDYELYLSFVRECKRRYRVSLYCYVLMPRYLQLLVEVADIPLSRVMQSLQSRYTRNFNIRYRKRGHLFQGRYKAVVVQKDAYLLEMSAYIHLNAVREGLVKDPLEYPWSSYPCYVNGVKENGLIDRHLLLGRLSNREIEAVRAYSRFVEKRLSEGHPEDLNLLRDQMILGSKEFVLAVQRRLDDGTSPVYDIPLQEIVESVASVLLIPRELFYTLSRNRQGAWGRAAAGYLARKLAGYQIKAVAEHFDRDPVVISQGIKRLEQRLRQEKETVRTFTALEEALTCNRKKIPV